MSKTGAFWSYILHLLKRQMDEKRLKNPNFEKGAIL
jgi:hypothetical protein